MERRYSDLFSGKVKYFVISHKKIGFGNKKPWWRVLWWNLTHRNDKIPYGYPCYKNQYIILTAATGEWLNMRLQWDKKDQENFSKEHNLKMGDNVTVYFEAKNSDGSHWSAGGIEYIIEADGWKRVGRIKGA